MIEMKETGVLDRIVDGKFAVILFENIGKEIIYPAEQLPSKVQKVYCLMQ